MRIGRTSSLLQYNQLLAVSFNGDRNTISVLLKRLAHVCHIPIGFEAATEALSRPLTNGAGALRISVKKGTVKDVLDAIISADPTYTWQETAGVINVLPRERVDALPDVVIKKFEVNEIGLGEALRRVLRTREIERWTARTSTQERSFASLAFGDSDNRTISLSLMHENVRTVVNRIMKAGGGWYWAYFLYGRSNCLFSLTMS